MEDLVSKNSLDRQFRTKLSKALSESMDKTHKNDGYWNLVWSIEVDVWKEALKTLEAEPDANGAVKRGVWVTRPGKLFSAKCSLCGNRTGVRTAYCSGCGAIMRT